MLSSSSTQVKQERIWYSTKNNFSINLQNRIFKECELSDIVMENEEIEGFNYYKYCPSQNRILNYDLILQAIKKQYCYLLYT